MNANEMSKICIACQECCNWLTFVLAMRTEKEANEQIKYYRTHGCRTHRFNETRFAVVVPSRCEQLTTFGCKCYDERPGNCRKYDGRKDMFLRDQCQLPSITGAVKNDK